MAGAAPEALEELPEGVRLTVVVDNGADGASIPGGGVDLALTRKKRGDLAGAEQLAPAALRTSGAPAALRPSGAAPERRCAPDSRKALSRKALSRKALLRECTFAEGAFAKGAFVK